ncbi:5'-phosphate oxidase [Mycobacterium sp. 1081908.1]|uniref:5'-phosphate oxidase n=1 Tax=Mycobacterium sp. 1081908.1 TaxID=1834066 RepID=UPI0007FE9C58|nr:5'-phosphate oxidase [Mycobacterium sp. 1081908.1]OBK43841.1 5'-phosphate oxidase [Mycobacterium sp. 1081908.1]
MSRFKTEMATCPACRREAEATVEYTYDSDGNVTGRRVRDVHCRAADCPGNDVPPHWS